MVLPYSRLTQARRWIGVTTRVAMVIGLLIPLVGLVPGDQRPQAIVLYTVAGLVVFLMGALAHGLGEVLFKIEANSHRIHELLIEGGGNVDKQRQLLEMLSQNSQISDGVKSITHREAERDALRQAIREDILKEDWESAYSLIEDMENRFGYRVEAYNYRKEVDEFRAQVIEDKVQASLRHAHLLIQERRWDHAQAEAERLQKLAPSDARVIEIAEELSGSKETYKNALMQEWRDAVDSRDLDRGIALLKELDPYLARQEAKELEQSAREIFKAKLLDLGVQFRQAVKERKWEDAVIIGDRIRNEFPNSLMAKEVTESMEALKAKAATAK